MCGKDYKLFRSVDGCALLFLAVLLRRKDCRKVIGKILVEGKHLNQGVGGPGEKPSWGETRSSGH